MSNIYIAGKLNSDEMPIDEFANELEKRGHVVLEKWWLAENLPTPYMDNLETSSVAAKAMIDAAYDCDVAILFPGDTILGAAIEFGAAVASSKNNPKKQVIVIDPHNARQSVFYAHPAVTALKNIAQVRRLDWY
jgi:hypothetical protein